MNFTRLFARRLKTRLIFWTALIIIVAVGGSFELRTRIARSMLERDLEEQSSTLVRAAIGALALGSEPLDAAAAASRLRNFVDADPAVARIDIVRPTPTGIELLASTAEGVEPAIDRIPDQPGSSIVRRGAVRELITVAPLTGTDDWLVAVTSMAGLDRHVAVNRAWSAGLNVAAIVAIVALMSFLFDRLISRRFDDLLSDLGRTDETTLFDALPGDSNDEIGLLAQMFNKLLARVQALNENLQAQVDEATASLNRRNQMLEETTQELIAMQKQLLQSERLATVGQMAATFAHEIGSPLSSLSAHVQLLLEESGLRPEHKETLGVVRQEIDAMVEIVNELLRAGRHSSEHFVPVDLNAIVEQVWKLVGPKLRSERIAVERRLEPIPPIRGYPLYLQEALLNLINNASDAMPGGGTLELETRYDEDSNRIRLRIADSGPGIDPGVVERVFEGFVTTKAMGRGVGLGLAIVRDIVASHNGTIELSTINGRGTAAVLTFPPLAAEELRRESAAHSGR